MTVIETSVETASTRGSTSAVSRLRRERLVLTVVFLLSLPAVTPRIYSSDEVQYFSYLRSLWFDHDVSFENEYRYFYDAGIARSPLFRETFLERSTEAGRRINFGTLGCALLWAPFYTIGDVTARLLHALGRDVAVDGYSTPYVAAVAYGSAFYGFLAILLSLAAAQRLIGRGALAAVAVWIGTPLLFYMYVAPPMSHAASAFTVAAFVLLWLHVRQSWSLAGMAALGALAALLGMVREQDVFFASGPALDFAWTLGQRLRGGHHGAASARVLAGRALFGALVAVVAFVPQALAYLALNGYVGPSRLVTRKMNWSAPHALEVLVSPEHGFLVWTPLAALGLVGLTLVAARASASTSAAHRTPVGLRTDGLRRIGVCLLVMVVVQVYIAGSVESWTVAGAFGQRRFVALTVLLVIGLAALQARVRRSATRAALAGAVVVSLWWNVGLMAQFGAGLMDRQRLEPARNAYTTFVTLPREFPTLVYRYLFDRPSFYRVPVKP